MWEFRGRLSSRRISSANSELYLVSLFFSRLSLNSIQKVEWIHDGQVIATNTTLQVDEINASMQGIYVCSAKNEHGQANISFNLNVLCESFEYPLFTR